MGNVHHVRIETVVTSFVTNLSAGQIRLKAQRMIGDEVIFDADVDVDSATVQAWMQAHGDPDVPVFAQFRQICVDYVDARYPIPADALIVADDAPQG